MNFHISKIFNHMNKFFFVDGLLVIISRKFLPTLLSSLAETSSGND